MSKGKLITVWLTKNRGVKMHEQDAIAQGHIPPPAKMAAPPENKMLPLAENKYSELHQTAAPAVTAPDDFSTIPGVGAATARALAARGISTFEELRRAGPLDYLSQRAMQAIEEWRGNG